MMTSQILKFVDFNITQKSKYLEKHCFFFKKNPINYSSRATLTKDTFVAQVTFNLFLANSTFYKL